MVEGYMFFQDAYGMIRIQDKHGCFFTCPSAEFVSYEPDYQPLQSPSVLRYWNETVAYESDGSSQSGDLLHSYARLAEYCERIAQYQAAYEAAHPPIEPEYPKIYVLLIWSGGDGEALPAIYPNAVDPAQKSLVLSGKLLSDSEDPASVLPVTYAWRIPVLQVIRERLNRDRAYQPMIINSFPLKVQITQGLINFIFSRKKEGIYMLSDAHFEYINGVKFGMPGQIFEVKLIDSPLFFKVIE